jgi:hypothetical protein
MKEGMMKTNQEIELQPWQAGAAFLFTGIVIFSRRPDAILQNIHSRSRITRRRSSNQRAEKL